MSSFATVIPTIVSEVKSLLPQGSHIEGVDWDKERQQLTLRWSNDRLKTGRTYHFDFPVENLKAEQVPSGVSIWRPDPQVAPAPVPATEPTRKGPVKRSKKILP